MVTISPGVRGYQFTIDMKITSFFGKNHLSNAVQVATFCIYSTIFYFFCSLTKAVSALDRPSAPFFFRTRSVNFYENVSFTAKTSVVPYWTDGI